MGKGLMKMNVPDVLYTSRLIVIPLAIPIMHGWGVSEFFRILGANARNSVNTAKFLSPAKPAKSPLGRGKTAKFSPARYWLYRMPHIRTVRARHIAPD